MRPILAIRFLHSSQREVAISWAARLLPNFDQSLATSPTNITLCISDAAITAFVAAPDTVQMTNDWDSILVGVQKMPSVVVNEYRKKQPIFQRGNAGNSAKSKSPAQWRGFERLAVDLRRGQDRLVRLEMPMKPIKAVPNNQKAAGTGTAGRPTASSDRCSSI